MKKLYLSKYAESCRQYIIRIYMRVFYLGQVVLYNEYTGSTGSRWLTVVGFDESYVLCAKLGGEVGRYHPNSLDVTEYEWRSLVRTESEKLLNRTKSILKQLKKNPRGSLFNLAIDTLDQSIRLERILYPDITNIEKEELMKVIKDLRLNYNI